MLITAGPWRPVWLETYQSRIADLWFDIQVSRDNTIALGKIFVQTDGPATSVKLGVTQDGTTVFEREIQTGPNGLGTIDIKLGKFARARNSSPPNSCSCRKSEALVSSRLRVPATVPNSSPVAL